MTESHSSSRHVDQHPVAQDAGVVDQHVEIAEGLDRGVDEPLAALPVADVVGVGHRLAARRPDLVDHLLGRRAIVARPSTAPPRSLTTTWAPSAANSSACSRPIPVLPR